MHDEVKRLIQKVSPREHHWVGNGFYVSTIFSVMDLDYRKISPFILMDHAASKEFTPTEDKLGVGEHPHRGFETVTFAIEGEIEHRDSGGGGGVIGTGDVQWMTAASGVVHDEFHSKKFADKGGKFQMVQLWVNLPAKDKMTSPKYQSLPAKEFKNLTLSGGSHATLIAGQLEGEEGPASTFTPITIFRLKMPAGCKESVHIGEGWNCLVFSLTGLIEIADEELQPRDMAVLSREGDKMPPIKASEDSEILVLAGEPIDEPVAHYGPFVMNTEDEIRQAMSDFQAGKMGTLVKEDPS